MDTLLCRHLYWYQHNSITEILFLPSPPGRWRKRTFAYVELLNHGAPGAEYLSRCPGWWGQGLAKQIWTAYLRELCWYLWIIVKIPLLWVYFWQGWPLHLALTRRRRLRRWLNG